MVATASRALSERESAIAVCAVVGFPSGAHRHEVKAAEAKLAVGEGAREIDMVVDLGAVKRGDWVAVTGEVAAVRAEVDGLLKVILETAALTDDELDRAARSAVAGGADLLKTSTGFHPAGGATIEAVTALAAVARTADPSSSGRAIGVKASGGIRDRATALAMVDAGATRLGCSASRAILDG
jgi:deoxyribose-phosphate aldolase